MRRMRSAGIEAFGDDVRLLELAAPAVSRSGRGRDLGARGRGWQLGRDRPGRRAGMSAADHRWCSASRRPELSRRWRGCDEFRTGRRCSLTHCRCDTRARGRSGLSLRPRSWPEAGPRPLGGRGRVPGARTHRRPGAQRGRTSPARRVGPRARRRRRDRRTRRAARGRAWGDRRRDGGPRERGARPRLWRARRRLSRSRAGRPACERHRADRGWRPP